MLCRCKQRRRAGLAEGAEAEGGVYPFMCRCWPEQALGAPRGGAKYGTRGNKRGGVNAAGGGAGRGGRGE